MSAVPAALVKAFGQLSDRAVVAVAVKSIAITLALFAGAGAGLYAALPLIAASPWFTALVPPSLGGPLLILAMLLVSLVGFWLLFRVVAVAVLQFFVDEVVAAVEARHFPALAAQARPLPFGREVAVASRSLLRTLGYNLLAIPLAAVLAFTAIGSAIVFLGVNAVLLGREFTDMAWLRHHRSLGADDESGNPVPRAERIVLGAAIAGLMLVPLVNLVAPLVGAAAGTHLVLRRIEGQR